MIAPANLIDLFLERQRKEQEVAVKHLIGSSFNYLPFTIHYSLFWWLAGSDFDAADEAALVMMKQVEDDAGDVDGL
jgi:hypothetical protein